MTGFVKNFYVDSGQSDYVIIEYPKHVVSSCLDLYVLIEFRPGRYRVTIKRMIYEFYLRDSGSVTHCKIGLERYGLGDKQKDFNNCFKTKVENVLEEAFSKRFNFNRSIQDDNW